MDILTAIDDFFANIVPIGDILWVFPQNFQWYADIPVIGDIPFAILLLVGMGIFFTFRTKAVQFRFFGRGLKTLTKKKRDSTGVSPLAAFMLSTAMRVGPGNITGVTGAIAIGGPGAVFWMWVSRTVRIWPVPLWKLRWRRFSRRRMAMSLSEDSLTTGESFWATESGSEPYWRCCLSLRHAEHSDSDLPCVYGYRNCHRNSNRRSGRENLYAVLRAGGSGYRGYRRGGIRRNQAGHCSDRQDGSRLWPYSTALIIIVLLLLNIKHFPCICGERGCRSL